MGIIKHLFTPLGSGVTVHYAHAGPTKRVAGSPKNILLLHGFPSSSYQYRYLIPRFAENGYTVYAPDYPGFGSTTVTETFTWTFDSLATAIADWLQAIHLNDFVVYIFDFGAPVFFRLVEKGQFKIRGIITQNGNLYEEGLGMPYWAARRDWWASGDSRSADHRPKVGAVLANPLAGMYINGTPADRLDRLDPMTWMSDYKLNIQGHEERCLDLLYDYGDNVRLYRRWQAWVKSCGAPILAMWGKNDPSFIPPGAEAIKRDNPRTQLEYLDGGHFALETHLEEAVEVLRPFLESLDW